MITQSITLESLDWSALNMATQNYRRHIKRQIDECKLAGVSHAVWDDLLASLDRIESEISYAINPDPFTEGFAAGREAEMHPVPKAIFDAFAPVAR